MSAAGALIDIATERLRQVIDEGWDRDNDDAATEGQLARAAACYAAHAALSGPMRALCPVGTPPANWPVDWDRHWWKPTNPRRDLVKAGALILAEIERLDRLAKGTA